MNILSFSTVFPNPLNPQLGLFVRARVRHMASLASVRVLAPVPVVDYRMRKWSQPTEPCRRDGDLTVYHPKWFYPPFGGAGNALFLFLQTIPTALRLNREQRIDVIDAHFGHPEG